MDIYGIAAALPGQKTARTHSHLSQGNVNLMLVDQCIAATMHEGMHDVTSRLRGSVCGGDSEFKPIRWETLSRDVHGHEAYAEHSCDGWQSAIKYGTVSSTSHLPTSVSSFLVRPLLSHSLCIAHRYLETSPT